MIVFPRIVLLALLLPLAHADQARQEGFRVLGGRVARHARVYPIYSGVRYDSSIDPFVLRLPDRYVLVRCRNYQNYDSVYLSESLDGIHGWSEGRIIAQGEYFSDEDLSCSPGLVIAPDGVWHLYFAASARQTMCLVEIHHSTSSDGGLTWVKHGRVPAVLVSDCSLLLPTPLIENGRIAVYFVVDWYGKTRLWRMEDLNGQGQDFTSPSPYGDLSETCQARPSPGHIAYANVAGVAGVAGGGCATQPNRLYLDGRLILEPKPGTFYADYVGTGNYLPGPPARLYFYGGTRNADGDQNSPINYTSGIGVLVFR